MFLKGIYSEVACKMLFFSLIYLAILMASKCFTLTPQNPGYMIDSQVSVRDILKKVLRFFIL